MLNVFLDDETFAGPLLISIPTTENLVWGFLTLLDNK